MMVTSNVLFGVALSAADDTAQIPPAVGLFAATVPLGVAVGLVFGDEPWGRAKLVSLLCRPTSIRSLLCCSSELLTRTHAVVMWFAPVRAQLGAVLCATGVTISVVTLI